jgi:putative endonuclease
MSEHLKLGEEGEKAAAAYLQGKSYAILELNWRYRRYEIDIIAHKDNFIIAVEVKTRTGSPLVEAERSITRDKQRRLIQAANAYIQLNSLKEEVRFDIIIIGVISGKQEIRHLEDAFYPMM